MRKESWLWRGLRSKSRLAIEIQLTRDLGRGTQVAGVPVAGDQRQRSLLATSRNQDRRMRPTEALGQVQRALEANVLALERSLVALLACPHPQAGLHRLL